MNGRAIRQLIFTLFLALTIFTSLGFSPMTATAHSEDLTDLKEAITQYINLKSVDCKDKEPTDYSFIESLEGLIQARFMELGISVDFKEFRPNNPNQVDTVELYGQGTVTEAGYADIVQMASEFPEETFNISGEPMAASLGGPIGSIIISIGGKWILPYVECVCQCPPEATGRGFDQQCVLTAGGEKIPCAIGQTCLCSETYELNGYPTIRFLDGSCVWRQKPETVE